MKKFRDEIAGQIYYCERYKQVGQLLILTGSAVDASGGWVCRFLIESNGRIEELWFHETSLLNNNGYLRKLS